MPSKINHTSSQAPERTIDLIDKLFPDLSEYERIDLMKVVTMAFAEGKRQQLKDLITAGRNIKEMNYVKFSSLVDKEIHIQYNCIRSMCLNYKIHYVHKATNRIPV